MQNVTTNCVKRPDLKPPRFQTKVYNESLLSPGYWFLSPIEVDRALSPGDGSIGPSIFDQSGELVWSGAALFDHWNALDFRVSTLSGESRLTLLIQQQGNGYVVNDRYEIESILDIGELGTDFNMHEFLMVDDGNRAIVIKDGITTVVPPPLDAEDAALNAGCQLFYSGFEEIELGSGERSFSWSSIDHVSPSESTYTHKNGSSLRCTDSGGWDYFHLNSVDKDAHGDYLLSARHTDTIYKVSALDGSILWRLGGPRSDFDMGGFSFSRQHDARFRGQNATHVFISFLDNAAGQDDQQPTSTSSRAVQLALRTDVRPMAAAVILIIDHPNGRGSFASRRGNYQVLPNGNSFIGWSELAMHSEHAPDGTAIMSASLAHNTLGSYRSYKFPFVGRPSGRPDVYAAAYVRRPGERVVTLVYASWNGATEIESWRVFKTTPGGDRAEMIASKSKSGFETAFGYDGFAAYVIVAAIDKNGRTIQMSEVIKTIPPSRRGLLHAAVADEMLWLQEGFSTVDNIILSASSVFCEREILTFIFGGLCSVITAWALQRVSLSPHPKQDRRQSQRTCSSCKKQ